MATAKALPARWTGPEFSEDLAWRTSLSPGAYAEDLAAAKREGAREERRGIETWIFDNAEGHSFHPDTLFEMLRERDDRGET